MKYLRAKKEKKKKRTIVIRDKNTILRFYKSMTMAKVGILHPGMDSIPETGHGKT